MHVDLVLDRGTIVSPDGEFKAAIAVDNGKIVAIGSKASMPRAEKVLELEGLHVLPGIIDEHVHFRDPGMTYKEDFLTGTRAAASGGITTVFDMPNTIPPVSTKKILLDKISAIENKAYVDYCLYGVLIEDNTDELTEMVKAGVIGFKVFLAEVTGNVPRPSNGYILEAFRMAAKLGVTIAAHAEDSNITQYYTDKLKASTHDPIAYCKARPPVAEAAGIQLLMLLTLEAGNKIHLVHTSSNTKLIKAAKAKDIKITAETCPQYLIFTEEDMKIKGALVKINPPLRDRDTVNELRDAVRSGIIDTIGSDHAPHSTEEKTRDNIWEASAGFIGVETMLPIMLTLVNQGVIKLTRLVEMMSEKPAKIFDLYPRKGAVRVGSDADFTIIDLKMEKTIKADELHSKNKLTPFDGMKVEGVPVYTIVGGKIVMERGRIVGEPSGRYVKPFHQVPT